MADGGTTEDRLAIIHVIQQVARAFDEKMHDALLPKCFEEQARILYRLRGRLLDFSMPGGIARFKHFHDRCYWTQHLVSPHIVEINSDRARGTRCTPCTCRSASLQHNWLIAAVYHDQLAWTVGLADPGHRPVSVRREFPRKRRASLLDAASYE
jgi:hypothetical protein